MALTNGLSGLRITKLNKVSVTTSIKIRKRIEVKGIVQGVGFRPFIYKLAHKFELTGFVSNNNNGVEIEVQGTPENISEFIKSISDESPSLSQIDSIDQFDSIVNNSTNFVINKSSSTLGNKTFISPDVSICDDCRNELFDKNNRRYLYPFINCTNCGPRFTIIENIPYDRKYTTMKSFVMCDECKSEYDNPLDRRFHAQPNACPECGPTIWLEFPDNKITNENPIDKTVSHLMQGKIIAIKGLGGFHLAVDANNDTAVERLRELKNREAKPLAIMTPNIGAIKSFAEISHEEEQLLLSKERPIVLLRKLRDEKLSQHISPGNKRIGVMLPYTPLHYILFRYLSKIIKPENIPALIMTSANLSEEPIVISNDEAKTRLKNIADIYLMHNREILIRADDSVTICINKQPRIIRRSRGYVPKSLPFLNKNKSILALGAELKNTICLTKENHAFISQHIGDLTNLRAYNFFTETIEHTQKIMDTKPSYIVYDMHPDYLSTKWAVEKNGKKSFTVQHHHAHMASCMLEHNLDENVIGIILDGTGYGYDKTIWGGEILVGNYTEIERFLHLEQLPLPGGDAAAKEPWRITLSYLFHAFEKSLPVTNLFDKFEKNSVLQLLEKNLNSPLTSSTGRLFDAVSFMAGGPSKIRYEAEAAIQLTQAVDNHSAGIFNYDKLDQNRKIIPLKRLVREIFEAVKNGATYSNIANRFHITLSNIFVESAIHARDKNKINKVVLSGGVFQNEVLLTQLENMLRQNNFEVYSHSKIPTNDGGISLGQAAIATKLIEQKLDSPKFIN